MNQEIDKALERGGKLYGSKASYIRALVIKNGGIEMAKQKEAKTIDVPITSKNCRVESVNAEEVTLKCKIDSKKETENEEEER